VLRTARHWLLGIAFLAILGLPGAAGAGPRVGEPAPDFALPGSDGALHRLSEVLTGQTPNAIVVAFFPKAFTPG
jgi:peroxiredoxin Q/BCP